MAYQWWIRWDVRSYESFGLWFKRFCYCWLNNIDVPLILGFAFFFCHWKLSGKRAWNERNRALKMIFGILLGIYGPFLSLFLEIAEEVLVTKLKKWESVTILWYLLVKLFIFVTFSHVFTKCCAKNEPFLKEYG